MPKSFSIIKVLFYFLLFFIFLNNSFNYIDPDFGWHLRAGQEIVENKTIPSINHHNYTLKNTNWVDHEWFSDAIMFWLYKNFGYITLSVFFALIPLLAIFLLNNFVQKKILKKSKRPILIFSLPLFGAYAMLANFGIRVQEITFLFLILLFLILDNFSKTKNIKILYFLPLLFLSWANLHGGFLLGNGLLFVWLAIKIIEKYLKNKNIKILSFFDFKNILSQKEILIFLLFAILSIAATLINPYGIKLYSYLFGLKDTFYLTHIAEWLPFYYFPITYKQLIYMGIAVACFFSYTILNSSQKEKLKISLWDLFLFFFFLLMALKSKRHFPLFFAGSYPFLILFFHKFLPLKINFLKTRVKQFFIVFFIPLFLLLTISILILETNFTNTPFEESVYKTPINAIDFLKDNPQYNNHRILNHYGWGGFMIWTYPERKLFIDGRMPQFRLGDNSILEEYYKFFKEDKAEEMLDLYGIKLVHLKKNSPLKYNWFEKYIFGLNEKDYNSKENKLKSYLEKSNKWKIIYEDDISYIYSKK